MENLIVLVLFMLASLASWLSKMREKKRRQSSELEEERVEAEWQSSEPEIQLQPNYQPIVIQGDATQVETTASQSLTPMVSKPLANEQGIKTSSNLVPEKRVDLGSGESNKEIAYKAFMRESSVLGQTGLAHDLDYSVSGKSQKRKPKVLLQLSRSSLKNAILFREILDRPRAYDT